MNTAKLSKTIENYYKQLRRPYGEAYELGTVTTTIKIHIFDANHETDHHPFDLWVSICGRLLEETKRSKGKRKEKQKKKVKRIEKTAGKQTN